VLLLLLEVFAAAADEREVPVVPVLPELRVAVEDEERVVPVDPDDLVAVVPELRVPVLLLTVPLERVAEELLLERVALLEELPEERVELAVLPEERVALVLLPERVLLLTVPPWALEVVEELPPPIWLEDERLTLLERDALLELPEERVELETLLEREALLEELPEERETLLEELPEEPLRVELPPRVCAPRFTDVSARAIAAMAASAMFSLVFMARVVLKFFIY